MFSNSTTVKVSEPIAKQSDKRKEDNKLLKEAVKKFLSLPQNKVCNIQIDEGCTHVATVVNHTKGRIGALLLNPAYFQASCAHCNIQIEQKDADARAIGAKVSKFTPEETESI